MYAVDTQFTHNHLFDPNYIIKEKHTQIEIADLFACVLLFNNQIKNFFCKGDYNTAGYCKETVSSL